MGTDAPDGPFFEIERSDPRSRARAGLVRTAHGIVPTPMFMPVGTRASVKAVGPDDLAAMGAKIVLANTYHLTLRPGEGLIASLGGLHRFMGWPGPIITDSGGFQIFSLSRLARPSEDGVEFRSTYDGSKVFLTPERVVGIQRTLGVDLMMCLDECTAWPATEAEAAKSLALTEAWAARCLAAWRAPSPSGPEPARPGAAEPRPPDSGEAGALFGIVQGGFHPALRRRAAETIASMGFPGQAVGGLALGEPEGLRLEAVEAAAEGLDPAKPMYLMGLGTPADLMEGIRRGADLFDCVMPTRNARNGQLFTRSGRLNILNARHKADPGPIDPECGCPACRGFSRAYLRHLHQNREPLFLRLASVHNLTYYLDLVAGARKALMEGAFMCYYNQFMDLARRGGLEG